MVLVGITPIEMCVKRKFFSQVAIMIIRMHFIIVCAIESAILRTTTLTPSFSTTCFDLPDIGTCAASLYFIWPQREEGLSCLCPVYNSDDGRTVFNNCISGCTNTDIIPNLNEGQVCISNLNASISEALFHFMCSTDPCEENCFVKKVLQSHRIFVSGTCF